VRATGSSDQPRLLCRASQYGYTDRLDQALLDEPEAISREDQVIITARSHRTAHALQLQEWEARRDAIARELSWLYSQRLQRDVRTSLRSLQRNLDRLDQKLAGR
jgi:hypothetical protein